MIGLGEALRILRTPSPGEEQRGPARLRAELRHQRLCTCGTSAASCPTVSYTHLTLPTKA